MSTVRLKLNSYKEAISNKNLVEIIDKVISTYPLTFVDLERLRKEIEQLDELFWIKDEEGKYLIVNTRFSSSLHFAASQIEGKPVDKFIPGYLLNFNKALDDYIKESRNAFIIEGFPFAGVSAREDYQTIEIPVTGSEGNVVAIIGVAQKIVLEPQGIKSTPEVIKDSDQKAEDARIYDFLVQNNPDSVFIYDKADLRFLEVNNSALKLYGYTKDEFLQLDLTDLYAPDDIQTLLDKNGEEYGKVYVTKPYRQKRKDGTTIFVELSRVKIKYYNEDALFNVIRNVTDKLKLEKESQEYNAIYKNSGDLFFITDSEGFIKSINDSVIETLGYSFETLKGSSFTSMVIDEDRGKINSSVFKSHSKEKLSFDASLKKAGNEFLEVQFISTPVFDYKGEVDSYTIICTPKREKEVKEVIKEVIKEVPVEVNTTAEDYLEVVHEATFLSGIFHDLLTPINVILGFVQELIDNIEHSTPEQKEAVEIINQNRLNLLSSMNAIIELTQIVKKQAKLKYDTSKIIEVIEKLKNEIRKNKIENIEIEFGKISMSLEIKTDLQKFQKLFSLIIGIISKVSGKSKIYLSASPLTKELFVFYVRDEYSLMTETFAEKLDSVFSDGKRFSGKESGISLLTFNLCKSLMQLLGGEFKVFDERESGFIFPLDLTKRIEFAKQEVEIDETILKEEEKEEKGQNDIKEEKIQVTKFEEVTFLKEPESKETVVIKQSVDISGLSCLYLEDQIDSQMLFSAEMKDLKEINFALGFEQALPLLKNKRFDFVVVDINLQGDYNGLDILKIIRTMPGYENTAIIAVTAYLLLGDIDKFINAGFTDFISKPILREKLIDSLEKVLFPNS